MNLTKISLEIMTMLLFNLDKPASYVIFFIQKHKHLRVEIEKQKSGDLHFSSSLVN